MHYLWVTGNSHERTDRAVKLGSWRWKLKSCAPTLVYRSHLKQTPMLQQVTVRNWENLLWWYYKTYACLRVAFSLFFQRAFTCLVTTVKCTWFLKYFSTFLCSYYRVPFYIYIASILNIKWTKWNQIQREVLGVFSKSDERTAQGQFLITNEHKTFTQDLHFLWSNKFKNTTT